MNYFELLLLNFLRRSKIKVEITGFDMKKFNEILSSEWKRRLEQIEAVVFDDKMNLQAEEKIIILKELFENDFCDKE